MMSCGTATLACVGESEPCGLTQTEVAGLTCLLLQVVCRFGTLITAPSEAPPLSNPIGIRTGIAADFDDFEERSNISSRWKRILGTERPDPT